MTFKATESFWRKFYALSPERKDHVREKWKLFKLNPFDSRLGSPNVGKPTNVGKLKVISRWSLHRPSGRFGDATLPVPTDLGSATRVAVGSDLRADRQPWVALNLGPHRTTDRWG